MGSRLEYSTHTCMAFFCGFGWHERFLVQSSFYDAYDLLEAAGTIWRSQGCTFSWVRAKKHQREGKENERENGKGVLGIGIAGAGRP